jgi:hypothetical protein
MIMKNQKEGVVMKKLLAVLCFVPVGVAVLVFICVPLAIVVKLIHLLLTNPLSFLISIGFVAGSILVYTAFVYGILKLTALGARQRRGR